MSSSDPTSAISTTIAANIQRLRQLSQQDVQSGWHRSPDDWADSSHPPQRQLWQAWPLSPVNNHHHIAWQRGKTCLWLHQRFTFPCDLNGYPLQGFSVKLALRWWAELAEIYIHHDLVQVGDLFDCWTRITLTEHLRPGQFIDVSLKLVSPGHDDGALVMSQLIFEAENQPCPEPSFIADELDVLQLYLTQLAPQHLHRLSDVLSKLPWQQVVERHYFNQALTELRESFQELSPWIKSRTIHCLGHAHLDLAWLWPVAETWVAAQKTFESVLKLQREFSELTFSHSSPALFEWLEHHHPQLFATIQQQVKDGRWAIDAGLWVEPDLNLPGGEAIVRQILYGQRYCLEKFGTISEIAWLPDSFGFSWQLPQLLSQGGIQFFATQKLRWNDTNAFPHHLFNWQGLDGTSINGVTLPPIGTDIDPIAMTQYSCDWEVQTGLKECLWLPGIGDHGGGPTRDMLLKARRWAESPFFPTITFSHAVPLFKELLQQAKKNPASAQAPTPQANSQPAVPPGQAANNTLQLPTWQDELYLELHRGCYTTHSDQKFYNRRCEDSLYQAELLASLAAIQGLQSYPQAALEQAWKQVLFNQFHDILPGSAIPEVFADANQAWQQALDTSTNILRASLSALGNSIPLPHPPSPNAIPILLFNTLSWARSETVAIKLPAHLSPDKAWQAQDSKGRNLALQKINTVTQSNNSTNLLIHVPDIPAIGYRIIWLLPASPGTLPVPPKAWTLENQHLQVTIDPSTGNIHSLIDKSTNQETFSAPGNQLQAFQDQGQYWDAWNIAPNYQNHPLPDFHLQTIEWINFGPVRQTIRVVRTFQQSTFTQDYILDKEAHFLTINTQVDWQETQVLVKAAFPFTISAPYATYEIPYGAIQRPTTPQTAQEKAKWEVPALRWADISQPDRGISILTDYKHGFDATHNQLRLTLLKAPLWPDPNADRGHHTFSYAIYPHPFGWQTAKTVQFAHTINIPIQPYFTTAKNTYKLTAHNTLDTETQTSESKSLLDLGSETVILSILKQAEDRENLFILRCYESSGTKTSLKLKSSLNWDLQTFTNLLEERSQVEEHPEISEFKITVQPWQVLNLAFQTKKSI